MIKRHFFDTERKQALFNTQRRDFCRDSKATLYHMYAYASFTGFVFGSYRDEVSGPGLVRTVGGVRGGLSTYSD